MPRRILTSADNLDDVKEPGTYWYDTGNVPSNAPFSNAAIVEVFGSNSGTWGKIQRATRFGAAGKSAMRTLVNSSWLEWCEYITTAQSDGHI